MCALIVMYCLVLNGVCFWWFVLVGVVCVFVRGLCKRVCVCCEWFVVSCCTIGGLCCFVFTGVVLICLCGLCDLLCDVVWSVFCCVYVFVCVCLMLFVCFACFIA